MMMPPDGRYTWHKKLCESGYYLHRRIIGDDDVDMSKFPGKSDYYDELSEWKKSYIFPCLPESYIETFLEIRKTCIIFFKSIHLQCVPLFLKGLSRLKSHLDGSSELHTLRMKYCYVGHTFDVDEFTREHFSSGHGHD